MRLSEFIRTERERILAEWEAFARSCGPSSYRMDVQALRDHAGEILDAVAKDLDTEQSATEQADKAEGKSDAIEDSSAPDTPAQSHGADRADSGFDLKQMVSEYRALRASVIRLWIGPGREMTLVEIGDLMRFNESIDQALAESSARYDQNIERAKEMFVAMLGHDLRTPLGAIIASAKALQHPNANPGTISKCASLILSSSARMTGMVNDLLDFARSRLGDGIPVARADMDLEEVCRQTVEELAALHPLREIRFVKGAAVTGKWDKARVGQVISNLISNALQHGAADSPITLTVEGASDEAVLAVQNRGVIPRSRLGKIFDPMHSGVEVAGTNSHNLGLGLYITERIVASHGGRIQVESSLEEGTTFIIHLPKRRRDDPG